MYRTFHKLLLSCLSFVCLFAGPAAFAENQVDASVEQVSSIEELPGGFQIFPVALISNSLYKQKERIFSKPDLIIRGAIESKQGMFIWGEDEDGIRQGHWVAKDGTQLKLEPMGKYVFSVKLPAGLSRVFWTGPEGQLSDLLPHSNTAANFVVNNRKTGVFSHISGGTQLQTAEGKTVYRYSFKLHKVDVSTGEVTHLSKVYHALSPTLKLKWIRDNLLQVLGSGFAPERLTIN